jgi:pyridoxal/pyridoxine/pyridoxamine kinase
MSQIVRLKDLPIKDAKIIRKAVADLQAQGVKCVLLENVVPNMFTSGQFRRATGSKQSDFVLRIEGAATDLAIHKGSGDSYNLVFDPTCFTSALAEEFDGDYSPWPDLSKPQVQHLHKVSKFLTTYSKNLLMSEIKSDGRVVDTIEINPKHEQVVYVSIPEI